MRTVEVEGLRIAYERAGDGPPLVLLHGVLADSRMWRRQTAELSDEFAVIAWDAPGCGHSSDPHAPFGTADWADSLAGFLDAIGVTDAHVAGLSWGGSIALELYRRHPAHVRSLILVDSYAGWKGSLPEHVCTARVERCMQEAHMTPGELVPRWMPGLLAESASPGLVDELTAILLESRPPMLGLMAESMGLTDQRDLLPDIGVPALLIWGEEDRRSPLAVAEQLRDAIPGARLVVIPQAGHMSNMEQPERFNDELREFCRRASPRPPSIHNMNT